MENKQRDTDSVASTRGCHAWPDQAVPHCIEESVLCSLVLPCDVILIFSNFHTCLNCLLRFN